MEPSTVGQAARWGQVEVMQELIDKGHPLDVSDNRGWKPTHEAADGNYTDCLKVLLQHGVTNVDWRCHAHCTALLLAARRGHTESVELLLRHGADPNLPEHMGTTPLYEAVKSSSVECVDLLLADTRTDVNVQQYCGSTALHKAAGEGHVEIVRRLLDRGASLTSQEDYGITAIFLAAQYGHMDCLKTMLEKADKEGILEYVVNCPAEDNATPLFLAAQEGHTECVRVLLDNGADANLMITEPRAVAVMAAIEFNHTDCLQLLLPHTKKFLLAQCAASPYTYASAHADGQCTQLLLRHGVDFNRSVDCGQPCKLDYPCMLKYSQYVSPLTSILLADDHCAARRLAVDQLLKAGASVNVPDVTEMPSLLAAIINANVPMIRLLLTCGASVDMYNPEARGNVALLASWHDAYMFSWLLFCGAEAQSLLRQPATPVKRSQFTLSSLCDNAQVLGPRLEHMLQFVGPIMLDSNLRHLLETSHRWKHLKNVAENTRSLAHICRLAIRQCLTPCRLANDDTVRTLPPLPTTLIEYLSYTELKAF